MELESTKSCRKNRETSLVLKIKGSKEEDRVFAIHVEKFLGHSLTLKASPVILSFTTMEKHKTKMKALA